MKRKPQPPDDDDEMLAGDETDQKKRAKADNSLRKSIAEWRKLARRDDKEAELRAQWLEQFGFGSITDPEQRTFLHAFVICGVASRAAEAASIPVSQHKAWLKDDPIYRQRFEEVQEIVIDSWEEAVNERAFKGYLEPVYQGGNMVGYKRKFSDLLAIFVLKSARPSKYRETAEITNNINVDVTGIIRNRALKAREMRQVTARRVDAITEDTIATKTSED